MKNKNGFISMTLVYSFFIVFMFLMVAIINCYSEKNKFLEAIDEKINKDIGVTRETKSTLINKILTDNIPLATNNIDFNKISNVNTGNGNGLYYIDDLTVTDENNDGIGHRIYFYRGTVANNFVVYGQQFDRDSTTNKIINSSVKNMCWRIVRTNEVDGVRLVYYGTLNGTNCEPKTSGINSNVAFNTNDNDNAYVGYTYGASGVTIGTDYIDQEAAISGTHFMSSDNSINDSTIKKSIDAWFSNNTNLYDNSELTFNLMSTDLNLSIYKDNTFVVDAIFCNDRKINSFTDPTKLYVDGNPVSMNTTVGYNQNSTYYAFGRILDVITTTNIKNTASYRCDTDIDRYSKSLYYGGTSGLKNALKHSIGLLTADEIIMAGGVFGKTNNGYFLDMNTPYWTMTPFAYDDSAKLFSVTGGGKLTYDSSSTTKAIYPVISIQSEISVLNGDGFYNDPYKVAKGEIHAQ